METFVNYCKNYIIDNIDDFVGNEYYGCDFGFILTEAPNADGTLTYSTYKAKEYLREWWNEAGEYWQYEKDNFGENMHNPFDNPEAFMVCMVIEGVNTILSRQEDIDENWNNYFTLTEEIAERIKSYVEDFSENDVLF